MIRLRQLTKEFGPKVILNQVDFQFPDKGRLSLVGANGAGKTTLLNLITGQDVPDSGEILIPQSLRLGYLPQAPNPNPQATVLLEAMDGAKVLKILSQKLEEALASIQEKPTEEAIHKHEALQLEFQKAMGYSLESRAKEMLHGIGLPQDLWLKSPTDLSGGMRMRLELVRMLLNEPQFLLLDEPTNHLDLPSLVWMEQYLLNYEGTLLFVTHDKHLMETIATTTLFLSHGQLQAYPGNYSSFVQKRSEAEKQRLAQRAQVERRKNDLQKFVDRFGAKASKAKQAQSRVKMIERLEDELDILMGPERDHTISLTPPMTSQGPRVPIELKDLYIGYDKPLTGPFDIKIERGSAYAIIGANGLGKSTLLKTIAKVIPPLKGDALTADGAMVSYAAQDSYEMTKDQETILEFVLKRSDLTEKQARSYLGAFLFSGDDVHKPTNVLSGGERNRILLLLALSQKAHVLLLDEPTNHLDLASIAALKEALELFEGTLIFVSHDRELIDHLATHIIALPKDHPPFSIAGNLQDYQAYAEAKGIFDIFAPYKKPERMAQEKPIDDHAKRKQLKQKKQQLEKAVALLDKEMESLHQRITAKETHLASLEQTSYTQIKEQMSQLHALKDELLKKEEQWLQLTTELQEMIGDS